MIHQLTLISYIHDFLTNVKQFLQEITREEITLGIQPLNIFLLLQSISENGIVLLATTFINIIFYILALYIQDG